MTTFAPTLVAVLEAIAIGREPAATFLRALQQATGAERVFLCSLAADNSLSSVYGADRDGFALANAAARVDSLAIAEAAKHAGLHAIRSIDYQGERGSRVCIAAPEPHDGRSRAVVVAEHRFREGAFDAIADTGALFAYFAALGQIVLRTIAEESAAVSPSAIASVASVGSIASTASSAPSSSAMHSIGNIPASAGMTTWTGHNSARREFPTIVGESEALQRALFKLDLAADSTLPVLLTGETGVGKELFARALHDTGPRHQKPFIAVNCGAIADALFESELFGHVRGAFTGADKERSGLLTKAEGGTLFLDEIGELPLGRQAALLRVLESRKVRAVGADLERAFDVRIVAATNRNLEAQVAKGHFREDLLFRINVVPILIPPLRERTGDIPLLIESLCASRGLTVRLSDEAYSLICAHDFPGNVRELSHLLQRLSLHRDVVQARQLPRELRRHKPAIARVIPLNAHKNAASPVRASSPEIAQKREINRALQQTHGNITHAAAELGITRHGLKKRMQRLGLRDKS
jgi:serine/threonine-protein kinase PknK